MDSPTEDRSPGDERLARYRARRNDTVTPEPSGSVHATTGTDWYFSIQHHRASSDHYDLRLGHDGVLLSWAIPKGPSTDPSVKRLAIRTEDHPSDYMCFEGTIPEGEYGAGSVIVWDTGTWKNATTDRGHRGVPVGEAIEGGHLHIELKGQKISGGYVLQHIEGPHEPPGSPDHEGRSEQSQWLFIKLDDDGADARRNPTSTEPESVVSARTVDEIADETHNDD